MAFRGLFAVACMLMSCGTAVADPVESSSITSQINVAGQSALQRRFASAQKIVRAGAAPFEVLIIDDQRSFLAQRNDGVVRLPRNLVTMAGDPAVIDALALIGLSYATHRPPTVPHLSRTAKVLTGVAGFVGREVAESQSTRAGTKQTDLLAQPVVNNPDRLQDRFNPMTRGMVWAKSNGGCEASIVTALKSMAGQSGDALLRQDAVAMLRALGSVAWSPDDRCAA
jgi:hypothetical protein